MDFRSQKLKPPPKRRSYLRHLLLGAAVGVLVTTWGVAIGLWLAMGRGPQTPAPLPTGAPAFAEAQDLERPPDADPTEEPTPEDTYNILPEIDHPQPLPLPTAEIDPWGTLDLTDGEATWMTFHLDLGAGSYQVGFYPYSWFPGVFETPVFDPLYSGAVTWTDDLGRTTIWAHSGPNQSMTPLQEFIERDEHGYTVLWSEAERRLDENIQNATVNIVQPGLAEEWGLVVAWARIPPEQVEDSLGKVMDFPAYLDETQPDRGWDLIMAEPNALILYFCGRQLAGDKKDPSRPYWQQTRYVLGIVPGPAMDWSPPGAGDAQAMMTYGMERP